MMLPRFLKALELPGQINAGNRVLVVLQFSGGNDGLNTVIPVRNDIYYRERPKLAIERAKALSIGDEAGLHPSLTCLKSLYDEGSLGILSGVGYPNPDRSHFRSMDIWQTASESDRYLNTGWIGRYLDAQCTGCDHPTQALEIDDVLSMALKGEKQKALALRDPKRLYSESREPFYKDLLADHPASTTVQPLDYLYKTMSETVSSADYIYDQSRLRPTAGDYPDTELGKNLRTIASLILSDINTRVYYVSLGSFDTHVNQAAQQERLFMQLNGAMEAFVRDLKANQRFQDVMIITFSEFGRRVAQNASEGTDHGTANTMFLISPSLRRQGLINAIPGLDHLDNGDLVYSVDFKRVYATLLHKWLAADDRLILNEQYSLLDFI